MASLSSSCYVSGHHNISPVGTDDRFSSLEDQIAYNILRFLTIEDLGSLMLVSKRCKFLCGSVPYLSVDNRNHIHDLVSRQRFNQFVDNFLVFRKESGSKAVHFNFTWSFQGSSSGKNRKRKKIEDSGHDEFKLVHRWLSKMSFEGGVERFSINMVTQEGNCNFFPEYCLYSKTVKDLAICSNNSALGFPKCLFPQFCSMLESLTLQSACIPVTFTGAILELSHLKSLYLYDCTGPDLIDLYSPSLKVFKYVCGRPVELCFFNIEGKYIEDIFLTWYPADVSRTKLQIVSFALKNFVWYGYPVYSYYLGGDRSHLQYAALYLTLPARLNVGSISDHYVHYVLPDLGKSAKVLRIHAETIEIFYKLGHLTTQLEAVRNLAIDFCQLTEEQIPIIIYFLKRVSCLETFYLTLSPAAEDGKLKLPVPPKDFGCNVDYWEAQDLTFIDKLKKVVVEVRREDGNGMELVKYLLKCARHLEDITILCPSSSASNISIRLNEFVKVSTKVNLHLKTRTAAT